MKIKGNTFSDVIGKFASGVAKQRVAVLERTCLMASVALKATVPYMARSVAVRPLWLSTSVVPYPTPTHTAPVSSYPERRKIGLI